MSSTCCMPQEPTPTATPYLALLKTIHLYHSFTFKVQDKLLDMPTITVYEN